jgi:hypothetical protein
MCATTRSVMHVLGTTALIVPFVTGMALTAHADLIRNSDPAVQAQIDAQLASVPGGVQVSPNEIAYLAGDVLMVFPETGGTVPTTAVARVEATLATSYEHGCPWGHRVQWYCFFRDVNFGGRMLQFKDCARNGLYQRFTDYNFNDETTSRVNTSSHYVYAYDNLGPSGYLWSEYGDGANPDVGVGNSDRASAFLTYC